jgi:hypothetical protein
LLKTSTASVGSSEFSAVSVPFLKSAQSFKVFTADCASTATASSRHHRTGENAHPQAIAYSPPKAVGKTEGPGHVCGAARRTHMSGVRRS